MVPWGAESRAVRLALEMSRSASKCTENSSMGDPTSPPDRVRKPANGRDLRSNSHFVAPPGSCLHPRNR